MKTVMDQSLEREVQGKVARKYRRMGYDVQENPAPDLLPDFMQGTRPDIVARSQADNVVVEIKRHRALKGSNELVSVAESVSGHPGWRFELIVLEDADAGKAALSDAAYRGILDLVRVATSNNLFGMACIYLVTVMVLTVRDLAKRGGISANKADRSLIIDLGFKGILPHDLVERCLNALALRDDPTVLSDETQGSRASDVQSLTHLCDQLRLL